MKRAKVAVLRTNSGQVLSDYHRLMNMVDYQQALSRENPTALKINISWHYFFPACSTTPWQLEGVAKALLGDGYDREKIYAAHNRTVVVSAKRGERANKHKYVVDKYGLKNVHFYEGEEWITYEPKGKLRVLEEIFPKGLHIPARLVGSNIIHLPTMKTHVFTTITGAMKNAFGGLLHERRHWTHSVIHETLVDLLMIQKEIHPGILAVTDGTFAGNGPGPRCMTPHVKNMILASTDQVAIDAIAAKMMGFDPMSLDFIRLAHEAGLGVGRPAEIEVVGEDVSGVNWGFEGHKNTFVSWGQKAIYWGPLKPLEKILLRTAVAPWAYAASWFYHDWYWYPIHGKTRVREAYESEWGRLFKDYERAKRTEEGFELREREEIGAL